VSEGSCAGRLSNLIVMFIIEKWKEKHPLVNIGQQAR